MNPSTLFPLLASLLLVACWTDAPQPPEKTDVDLAGDCLAQLAECTDWKPIPQAPPPARVCEVCSEYDMRCQDRRDTCVRENATEASMPSLKSPCQVKAEICIRLVEATNADKEIHHHSTYGK
jgi:hypothetical protein